MKNHEVIYVRWVDSGMHLDHGWASREDYTARAGTDRLEVESVGFLMDENDEVIVLGQCFDASGNLWNGAQLIHKPSIIERTALTSWLSEGGALAQIFFGT